MHHGTHTHSQVIMTLMMKKEWMNEWIWTWTAKEKVKACHNQEHIYTHVCSYRADWNSCQLRLLMLLRSFFFFGWCVFSRFYSTYCLLGRHKTRGTRSVLSKMWWLYRYLCCSLCTYLMLLLFELHFWSFLYMLSRPDISGAVLLLDMYLSKDIQIF